MKKSKTIKELVDRRAYKLLMTIEQDPYDEGNYWWSTHGRRKLTSKTGSKNIFSWKRKEIYQFEYRAYRTWKYNRKTKWK